MLRTMCRKHMAPSTNHTTTMRWIVAHPPKLWWDHSIQKQTSAIVCNFLCSLPLELDFDERASKNFWLGLSISFSSQTIHFDQSVQANGTNNIVIWTTTSSNHYIIEPKSFRHKSFPMEPPWHYSFLSWSCLKTLHRCHGTSCCWCGHYKSGWFQCALSVICHTTNFTFVRRLQQAPTASLIFWFMVACKGGLRQENRELKNSLQEALLHNKEMYNKKIYNKTQQGAHIHEAPWKKKNYK